jgi:hypothetical protein
MALKKESIMNEKKQIGKNVLAFALGVIITAGICSLFGCTGTLTYTLKAYEAPTETKADPRTNLERFDAYRNAK